MIFDLMRALPVAVGVGLAPGWFWARLLVRSADLYEHIAYSIALSLALVAAVVLVPAHLLGMGVTLGVAIASPLVVLFSGLWAYLRFGGARKDAGGPLSSPSPLGVGSLASLAAAFALALGVATGVLPSARFDPPVFFEAVPNLWMIAPIASLVVLAGGLEIRRTRAQQLPAFYLDQTQTSPALRGMTLAVLVLALVRGYSGAILHDWPFLRGVDLYSHAVMADLMVSKGEIEPYLIYPPGFHSMTAILSRLSGLQPLEVFSVLAPALLLLPALALYAFTMRVWGWECGIAAALFSVLLGGTYYYNDAMYPNLVTSQFLLVLAVGSLVMLLASPTFRRVLFFALLGSSVVLYHQVSSLYLAALLAVVGPLFLPYLLIKDRKRGLALLSSMALLGVLCVLYAWDTYHLGAEISGIGGGTPGGSATDAAVSMVIGTQYPYLIVELIGNTVSQPVAWLGLLGAILIAGDLLRKSVGRPQALAYLTLLLWTLILAAGACTTQSGFPQRFGRDLGVPLAVLGAFGFMAVVRSRQSFWGKQPAMNSAVASLAVLSVLALVGVRAASSIESAGGPSGRMTMTPRIAAAGEWLREHNTGGNIMVSPQSNQVPSRMMLAMGGYSAMQSFERWQIERPRDLPPTGARPLKDVLWVMSHPADRRSAYLLKKHDVTYIVLYKRMPDRPIRDYWRGFEARPDLYSTVFENGDVLILTRN